MAAEPIIQFSVQHEQYTQNCQYSKNEDDRRLHKEANVYLFS